MKILLNVASNQIPFRYKKTPFRVWLFVIIAALFEVIPIHSYPGTEQKKLQNVTLQLNGKHQFQFAGYYAAIEKGYFEDAGIQVKLIEAVEGQYPADAVYNGTADFGICETDILLQRSNNKKGVVLACIFQHSSSVIVASTKSNIHSVRDFAGKKIKIDLNDLDILNLLDHNGITLNDFTPLTIGDLNCFIRGECDAITVNSFDEPYLLDEIQFDFIQIIPMLYGIDYYGDLLFTTENLIAKDPELVDKFRKAVLKGWEYAMGHQDEIINNIYTKYKTLYSLDKLHFEATQLEHLISGDLIEIGYSKPERWQKILLSYQKSKLIDPAFTTKGLFYSEYEVPKFVIPWKIIAIFSSLILLLSAVAVYLFNNGKKLRKSIKRFDEVISQSEGVVWEVDAAGLYTFVSPTSALIYGYTPDKLIGKLHFYDLLAEDKREQIKQAAFEAFKRKDKFRNYINQIQNPLREIVVLSTNGTPILNESGKLIGYRGIDTDITKQIADENKLKETNSYLNNLINYANAPIIVWDASFQITRFNNAFEVLTGLKEEEVLGKSLEILFPPIQVEQTMLLIRNSWNKERWETVEIEILHHNQSKRTILWNSATIFATDGITPVATIAQGNDITDQKGAMEEIKTLNEDLESKITDKTFQLSLTNKNLQNEIEERKEINIDLHSARDIAEKANNAKSEFMSRMSHELRTPMNSILGFAQLLDMGKLDQVQKRSVGYILNGGKQLLGLINEVLDISRIESGHLSLSIESIQLSSVIEEMIEIVIPLAKARNITFQVEGENDDRIFVKADIQRLKQVLLNLFSNAIKYNCENGFIYFKTEINPLNATGLSPVRISITDTGRGILPEDIPRLFIPFDRIGAENSETEGTGLGLSIVKKLIGIMDGEIGVQSVPNEGSTFWIEIPQCTNQMLTLNNKADYLQSASEIDTPTGTILYIEDNKANIKLVQLILQEHRTGIRLITDLTGNKALQLAIENEPDLILLDLNLPDIHGSEILVLLQAEEKTQKIPVIVISANAMPEQIKKLKHLGAKDYLTKPLDLVEFTKLIDKFIVKNQTKV